MSRLWSVSAEVFFPLFHESTARRRRELLTLLKQIAKYPDNCADYTERGPKGRLYLVAHTPQWIITYWVDTDQWEVRFVSAHPVRR